MPPRGGQLSVDISVSSADEVSSHAPAKGATAISHNFYRILLHELLNFSRFLRAKILKYVKFE